MQIDRDDDWQDYAACIGYDRKTFFGPDESDPEESPNEKHERQDHARSVCRKCPVRVECLEYALAYNIRYGVWGGMTDEQRRSEQRKRTRARRREIQTDTAKASFET